MTKKDAVPASLTPMPENYGNWLADLKNRIQMRAFTEAWPDNSIVQQAVGQLPWGHNLVLLSKLKSQELRTLYAPSAEQIEQGLKDN